MKWTDICQGEYLGNCWFVAAAASLTVYPRLLERVVPPQQSFQEGYAGIFHFQFWQYGKWVDVVIDDRLPITHGKLVFVSSEQKTEFWPALLEKAYAKLNGSYEALIGGWMNEAFVAFTGGLDESVNLKLAPPYLFHIIQSAVEKRSLMGTCIKRDNLNKRQPPTPEGLVKGHAYSVIGVFEVIHDGCRIPLIRLRNPWGEVEWNGRWSDNSSMWSLLGNEQRVKLNVKREDGDFWMQMDDFMRYFDILEICSLTPDSAYSDIPKPWQGSCFNGKWVRGHNAGGCRNSQDIFWNNPQFLVTLEGEDEKHTILVSLMQKDRRKDKAIGRGFLSIGFEIYQVPKEFGQMTPLSQRVNPGFNLTRVCFEPCVATRDITARYNLSPGRYLIIPTTSRPDEEASFNLRVFTETKNTFKEVDCEISAKGTVFQESKLRMTMEEFTNHFKRHSGQDQEISPKELQKILVENASKYPHLKTDGFSMEICEQLVKIADLRKSGKLLFNDFKYLWSKIQEWEHIFIKYDHDRSGTMDVQELRLALDLAGFQLNNKLVELLCLKYGDDLRRVNFDNFLSCMGHLMAVFGICYLMNKNKDGVISLKKQQWLQMARLQ